ncbi:MAG: ribosome biogenesis GTPase Der [Planctomycetota bacterium]|nr:ribosome biogenesis GTPase Der [Planctomycetota bacterium]
MSAILLPTIAIVGRPNVGKSCLLNTLAGQRISIVDDVPGVTRDRVSAVCQFDENYFELIDTGGYGIEDHDNLTEHVENQLRLAIGSADLILFVVDIVQDITPLDTEVAQLLRSVTSPVQLVANKADGEIHRALGGAFAALGFGEPICVSALHGHGRRELCERIIELTRDRAVTESPDPVMKVAVVGRRNVGKSSFINAIAGQERVIVSEVPGTTRDAIDVRFTLNDREFVAIDTAGVRKPRKQKTDIEFYGYSRALSAIRRADVILFMIDSTLPIGEVDKKLARYIVDAFKPVVIVINKWDLAKGRSDAEAYGDYIGAMLQGLSFAPLAFTTATEQRNIQSTIDLAGSLFKQARMRVTTGMLNRALEDSLARHQPPADHRGAQPKIYYATQISTCPPTIVFFVNNPALMREQYKRFMAKRFRETLPFEEVPVRFLWRVRRSQDTPRGRRTRK